MMFTNLEGIAPSDDITAPGDQAPKAWVLVNRLHFRAILPNNDKNGNYLGIKDNIIADEIELRGSCQVTGQNACSTFCTMTRRGH
jgi:hypothetical protein